MTATATSGSSTRSRRSRSAPAARSASQPKGLDEPFFALNGDSLRETDLDALVAFHRERSARATILLTPVEDPTRYGLVRVNGDGRVLSFLEKPRPEEIDTNLINAGLYVLEPDVLDLIPSGRAVSIEREVFPQLVEEQSVYGDLRSPATGSTSVRPTPICRPTATCSSATSSLSSATRSARTTRSSSAGAEVSPARGSCRPSSSVRAHRSARERASGAWP